LERLEDRCLPSADLVAVATGLAYSAENFSNIVRHDYQRYLGRTADAAGLQSWVAAMASGLTDEQVEAGFIGSPEYVQNHGGQGEGWVRGMYRDLLGRDPAASEVGYWLAALGAGASDQSVAYGFAASAEREGQRVTQDYENFLGRDPDAWGISNWVNQFRGGLRNESVVAGFVASPEFRGRFAADADWLAAAYDDILGRAPAVGDYAAWDYAPPAPWFSLTPGAATRYTGAVNEAGAADLYRLDPGGTFRVWGPGGWVTLDAGVRWAGRVAGGAGGYTLADLSGRGTPAP